jgi:precorrin-2 dehydrogenase/sirohydrochlorin ferrochelatase
MGYYPIFVNLNNRPCLVIGSGILADEKELQLRQAGARVTRSVSFNSAEALEIFLIVAAVKTAEEGEVIYRFAEEHRILVNVVDQTAHCSFIAPAILQRRDLLIAISTSGKCPALAGRIRRELEEQYGNEYGQFLDLLGETRDTVKQRLSDFEQRRIFYQKLFDAGLLEIFQRDGAKRAQTVIMKKLELFRRDAA